MRFFDKGYLFTYFVVLSIFLPACSPLIGPYSPTAYENATSLKAKTLALMDKATEPYQERRVQVEGLLVEIDSAYEYVKGIPKNDISAKQWEILKKKDGKLIGKFFGRWQEKGKLGKVYIGEFQGLVSDAFDEIICLEANKKKAKECLGGGGSD